MLPVLNLTYFYLFIAVFMSRWYGGYNCIKQKLSLPGRLPFLMFIISLTTSLLLYAVSHDFSKSHCQSSDWLNGIHLIRWGCNVISRLRCLIPWQIRSTYLWCSCPWVLLDRERITYQATLFICYRSTRLYSGVLTYALPIMLICAVRLRFSNRHGYYFSYLTGSSSIWDFSDSFWHRV